MIPPGGHDPEYYEMKAMLRQQKLAEIATRERDHPNTWFARDIFTLTSLALFFVIMTFALLAGAFAAAPFFDNWVGTTRTWIVCISIGVTTLVLAGIARWVRDGLKAKWYFLLELSVGAALSVQGAIQAVPSGTRFFAFLIAFVGGLRIAIDGWKRFVDNESKALFSSPLLLRSLRQWQKA